MARQANSRNNGPAKKRTVSKKRKAASNSKVVGAFLIFLLVLLVGASIFALTADKDMASNKDAKNSTVAVVKKPKDPTPPAAKTEIPPAKPIGQAAKSEDIAALIRLILYDYEISRSAIEERVSNSAKGKSTFYFSVKCHAESIDDLKLALASVLMQKGYNVNSDKTILQAESDRDAVEITFISADKVKTADSKSKTGNTKKAENVPAADTRPTPPAPSDTVVKLAILLDDGGSSIDLAERFVKMKYPLGLAVLPHLKYSGETARLVSSYRKTLFLHFPMQPKSYPSVDPGKGAVLMTIPEILIEGIAKENFDSLGVPVDGVNNHMGSEITEDTFKMAQILGIVKKYTDTFVDSRTTAKSVAYDECVKAGLRCGVNKRFIDNDNDVNLIIEKIYEAAELAKKNGEVLAIGHLRKNTLDALDIALPILEERRIAIVPIRSVVR